MRKVFNSVFQFEIPIRSWIMVQDYYVDLDTIFVDFIQDGLLKNDI